MITIWLPTQKLNTLDLLNDGYFFNSKSEARRALNQGAKIKVSYFFADQRVDVPVKEEIYLYGVPTYLVGSSNYKYKQLDK